MENLIQWFPGHIAKKKDFSSYSPLALHPSPLILRNAQWKT